MNKPYLKYFIEWNPEAFKQARVKGLLDEPSKKAPNIPDYILEYIESSSPYNSEWQDVNFYVNNLNHIKKNKIDNKRYSIRIVIYKNNFYSIGDNYKRPFLHMDILIYLVLKEGLKFKNFDDFIEFNYPKYLNTFLCLELKDPTSQYGKLSFSESYEKLTALKAKEFLEKNTNNYKNITKKILEESKVPMSTLYGKVDI